MKRIMVVLALLLIVALASFLLLTLAPTRAAETSVTLLNPPPAEGLVLPVGESYTFQFEVTSDTPFKSAAVMPDPYFPGRGIFVRGGDHARGGTSALLELTITGKNSTADFPGGCVPLTMFAGMRYQGGVSVFEQFDVQVCVP